MTSLPEIFTVLEPCAVSLSKPVLGYGIGTPGGVAGVSGGVKQTSGNAQMDLPPPALQAISRPLAKTSLATGGRGQADRTAAARAVPSVEKWLSRRRPGL
jgi:hypothetical protein